MLLQPYRLPNVLLLVTLVSALAPAYPPPGAGLLKPRYLPTGTGNPHPPPIQRESVAPPRRRQRQRHQRYRQRHLFYILTSALNASRSDKHVFVGAENDDGSINLILNSTLADAAGSAVFKLNATGTPFNEFWGGIACTFGGTYAELMIDGETYADEQG